MMGVQLMGKDSGGKGGVIVNVASVLGLEAFPQLPIYSATNHAVIAFSRSFSVGDTRIHLLRYSSLYNIQY